jgi:hypothetical protein
MEIKSPVGVAGGCRGGICNAVPPCPLTPALSPGERENGRPSFGGWDRLDFGRNGRRAGADIERRTLDLEWRNDGRVCFGRPFGTESTFYWRPPNVETLGYFRMSLRDRDLNLEP